jgi:hypothetical protein
MDRLIRGIEEEVSALRERSTSHGPRTQEPKARKSADTKSSTDPRAVPSGARAKHREEPAAEMAPVDFEYDLGPETGVAARPELFLDQ